MVWVWIALALIVLVLLAGFFLAAFSLRIRRQTLDEARAWQAAHYDISWYDAIEKTSYTVKSWDGYALHAQLLRNPAGGSRYILISHGYTDNRFGSLKYARMYLELGFHVIIYDLRGHGENAPTFCTYSVRESRDLDALIRDCRSRWPDLQVLGLHGESLGGATSVAVLKYRPQIDFVVADCGFSEIMSVMRRGLQAMHLPGWLVYAASFCAKLRYGFSYSQMRPIDSLAGNQIPILFLHGQEDDFILPLHSQRMQQATSGFCELHLIPGAGHAASVLTAPEDYRRYVEEFLHRIGVL